MFSQKTTGILHTPVGSCVQRGPAIPISELGVIASLEEQPGGRRVLGSRTRTGIMGQELWQPAMQW